MSVEQVNFEKKLKAVSFKVKSFKYTKDLTNKSLVDGSVFAGGAFITLSVDPKFIPENEKAAMRTLVNKDYGRSSVVFIFVK